MTDRVAAEIASIVRSQGIDLRTVPKKGNPEAVEPVSGVVTKVTSHVIVRPGPMDMEVEVVEEEDVTDVVRKVISLETALTRPAEGAGEGVLGVAKKVI